jgi:monofunctional biosynthetic peptidoglycan transglycosylase
VAKAPFETSVTADTPASVAVLSESEEQIEKTNMNEVDNVESPTDADESAGRVLFDFGGGEPRWFTVNDDVMGGVSRSTVAIDEARQQLTFAGELSLANNGGFASVRSQWTDYDLAEYAGVVLRVLGDGRTYQLRIQTEITGRDISYMAPFTTTAGAWQDVYIPFSEMVPTFRGFVVREAGQLLPEYIRSFGLMLADKQEGGFVLEVDRISALRSD